MNDTLVPFVHADSASIWTTTERQDEMKKTNQILKYNFLPG